MTCLAGMRFWLTRFTNFYVYFGTVGKSSFSVNVTVVAVLLLLLPLLFFVAVAVIVAPLLMLLSGWCC